MNRKTFLKSLFGIGVTAVVAPKVLIPSKTKLPRYTKLKAHWAFESQMPLLDAEAELTRLMSEYVAKEIDLSLIDDMINTHKKCQMLY